MRTSTPTPPKHLSQRPPPCPSLSVLPRSVTLRWQSEKKGTHISTSSHPGQLLQAQSKTSDNERGQVWGNFLALRSAGLAPPRPGPERRTARARWPFKGALFLRLRPLPRRRSSRSRPRLRRGSHLNFSSPRAARRPRTAGGGRLFARVGCTTSGSARPAPCTRGHFG